jgi:hypothetical protein
LEVLLVPLLRHDHQSGIRQAPQFPLHSARARFCELNEFRGEESSVRLAKEQAQKTLLRRSE